MRKESKWERDAKEIIRHDFGTDNFYFGYIIGVILGDGSLCRFKDRGYERICLSLAVKDYEFLLAFRKAIKEVFSKELKIYNSYIKYKGEKRRYFKVCCYDKLICLFLEKYIIDFSWVKNTNINVKRGMLKGLFDSEGSIYKYKIIFYNQDEKIIKLFKYLCSEFQINTGKWVTHTYISIGKDCKKFYNEIGFTIKRKKLHFENNLRELKNRKKYRHWLPEEISFLKKKYKDTQFSELQSKLAFSKKRIRIKANKLKLYKRNKWDKEKIIERFRIISEKLGHIPTEEEARECIKPSFPITCKIYFGSFSNMREAAKKVINFNRVEEFMGGASKNEERISN